MECGMVLILLKILSNWLPSLLAALEEKGEED